VSDQFDEFTDLLGAYALDAVDGDERDAIEAHLSTCPRCRAEVAEHREVASFLSQAHAPAPEGVWDRIAAELAPPAPPLRMSFSPAGEVDPLAEDPSGPADAPVAPVVPFAGRQRSVRMRTFVAVASAAAVVIAVLGIVAINQSRNGDAGSSALPSYEAVCNRSIPRAKLDVRLKGTGKTSAQAIVDADGRGCLVTAGLPRASAGHVYQLWGKVDGTVLSLGTFGGKTSVVPFQVDPSRMKGVQAFAVTEELAPGVLASKQPALVAGTP
jgi:hypothetical protein